jgi:hypothetical protein
METSFQRDHSSRYLDVHQSGGASNVLPGQVVGVDPDISGNAFVARSILDIETGSIIYEDSGTLGDGHDINCLGNTYGRDVKSQGLQ